MLNLERPQCPTFDKETMPHVGKALPSVSSGLELGSETTVLDSERFPTEQPQPIQSWLSNIEPPLTYGN